MSMISGPLWFHWALFLLGFITLICIVRSDLKRWIRKRRSTPKAVDYIGACEIVDAYIDPATRDMSDGTRISVRINFIERF